MSKKKPICPQCGSGNLCIKSSFTVKADCHYLERKKIAYYRCCECKCECILITPQGELTVLKDGQITRAMAERVLKKLGLPISLADKLI